MLLCSGKLKIQYPCWNLISTTLTGKTQMCSIIIIFGHGVGISTQWNKKA